MSLSVITAGLAAPWGGSPTPQRFDVLPLRKCLCLHTLLPLQKQTQMRAGVGALFSQVNCTGGIASDHLLGQCSGQAVGQTLEVLVFHLCGWEAVLAPPVSWSV